MKTPLKPPLTELKSATALKTIIPRGSAVHTTLLYDGKLELDLTDGNFVIAHTNKYVIYELWRCLLEDPERVAAFVEYMHPVEDQNIFYLLQENWPKYSDPFVRAGLFVLLNRYSETGLVSSGEMKIDNYSALSVNNLKRASPPDNLHLILDPEGDFFEPLNSLDSRCDYAVIPAGNYKPNFLLSEYKKSHEETNIDHERLFDFFKTTKNKTLLVYEHSKAVVKKYSDYNQYIVDRWGRLTESDKFSKEVIIANF